MRFPRSFWMLFCALFLVGFLTCPKPSLGQGLPANAELDYTGSNWKCSQGYKRAENECVSFAVPKNASIAAGGNSWNCNLKYTRSGEGCRPMNEQEIQMQNLMIARIMACGKSYDYDVSGDCGGENVNGDVEACSNSKEVTGTLYYDNGNSTDFDGEWVSKDEIEGTDGLGNSCDLETD